MSKSKISVIGNKGIAQFMKLVETMQTILQENENKMELITTILQTFVKNAPKNKGENLITEGGEIIRRKKKGRTPQTNP